MTRAVFRVPALIGAATLIGLLSALLANGVWDALSWTLLSVPVIVGALHALRRRERAGSARQ